LALMTRLPTTCTSYVVSGLGESASAIPVWPGPYGSGACVKSSCQVSALAGRMTTVFRGTITWWPLTTSTPPEWTSPGSRVAD